MSKQDPFQNKVEEILNSLSGIQRAEANPFLYTRVLARLEPAQSSVWDQLVTLLSKPAIAATLVFTFLLINTAVFISGNQEPTNDTGTINGSTMEEGYTASSITTIYDY